MMQFFRLAEVTEKRGLGAMLQLLTSIRTLLMPVFDQYDADVLEQSTSFLVTFESAEEALRCSLAVRAEIMMHNSISSRQGKLEDMIPMGGTGLHVSELLFVPGTDIHWGDAVNTASKLSEDAQQDGSDLIMTADVKAEVESASSGEAFANSLTLESCSFLISKVQLPAFRVVPRFAQDRPRSVSTKSLAERKQNRLGPGDADGRTKMLHGLRAALVTDMSGFTRMTRQYGIVHFASLIVKMRSLFMPHLKLNGADEIFTEADNFIVLFPSAVSAMTCALSCEAAVDEYNKEIRSDKYRIKIGGYGLALHDGPVRIDPVAGVAYGLVVDRAYHLGEEVAENNVCVDPEFYSASRSNLNFFFNEFLQVCASCFIYLCVPRVHYIITSR